MWSFLYERSTGSVPQQFPSNGRHPASPTIPVWPHVTNQSHWPIRSGTPASILTMAFTEIVSEKAEAVVEKVEGALGVGEKSGKLQLPSSHHPHLPP